MIQARPRGRPARGSNEVGRTRIVEGVRAMMREREVNDFSRKNLANYCSVTPALVTYYFPKRTALIEAVTKPVLERYLLELCTIVQTRDDHIKEDRTEQLRDVIRLLIRLYSQDGRIYEAYSELIRLDKTYPNYIELMSRKLLCFLEKFTGAGSTRLRDLEVLQRAIWGMCEIVARGNFEPTADGLEDTESTEIDVSVQLFDLLTNGLRNWTATPSPQRLVAAS